MPPLFTHSTLLSGTEVPVLSYVSPTGVRPVTCTRTHKPTSPSSEDSLPESPTVAGPPRDISGLPNPSTFPPGRPVAKLYLPLSALPPVQPQVHCSGPTAGPLPQGVRDDKHDWAPLSGFGVASPSCPCTAQLPTRKAGLSHVAGVADMPWLGPRGACRQRPGDRWLQTGL